MQYAVIRSGGKQYKASVGDILTLDKFTDDESKNVVFDEVLLLVNDSKVIIGNPSIKGASVGAKLIENKRGKKIEVRKFKAKARYRKKIGFRSNLSVVEINNIKYKEMFSSKKIAKPTKTAAKDKKK